MTTLPYTETEERLRVSTNGDSREFDESEVLGPLALQHTVGGWSVRDVGEQPMLFLDGCHVVQLPLFPGRPVALRVGGPDGQLVELEVVPYVESFLEYGPDDTGAPAMRPAPAVPAAPVVPVSPVAPVARVAPTPAPVAPVPTPAVPSPP
jgi:hypothetical protein